jgi:hypothetical protein
MIKGSVIMYYYMDDICFCFRKTDEAEARQSITSLQNTFELKGLGELRWFLGIHVVRNRRNQNLLLSQKAYIEEVAHRFGLAGNFPKAPKTPLSMKQLNPSTNSPSTSFRTLYQKKIGSVLYAAIQTRPNIAFAASRLSRFNYRCDEIHMNILNDLIRYL